MKVLVLGASGMLGNAVMRVLSENKGWQVFGTVRSSAAARFFPPDIAASLVAGVDVEDQDALVRVFASVRPDVVINCIGLIKQLADGDDPLLALPINAMLPHRLARLCELAGSRLVHVSTDCVFSGSRGAYVEEDVSDALDLYGKSKFLGEVHDAHAITLRTSIIGHELQSAHGLVEWFLSQQERCKGYRRAVFSGLPTVVLAKIIRDVVIPRPELSGLYHLAAAPISKFDLLTLVARQYNKNIEIVPDDTVVIDRSLRADRFQQASGYVADGWPELIKQMHAYK
ncbi:MAG: SDR family oxidoreductase [Hylemonella sp.]|uniref:dTDP-4-dehydrorhamnose reductase family protein n=1 Tax=Hylemonella sp. TaxID=2066020 RepID=UPI0022BD5DC3|nr:SDR family oxidoreductase [Hylemonella sp.]MCZ8253465.1 SDR family oxidoreductase [Hylemonella sp.]